MITTAQKVTLTSQVNLQSMQHPDTSKVLVLNIFTDEQEKLQAFLAKLKLYIGFNHKKFRSEMNKELYTVFLLKNAVFN